jgi:hypothetical protein
LVWSSGGEALARLWALGSLLAEQFGLVGAIAGLAAMFWFDSPQRFLRPGFVWLFGICTVFAIGYNTADSYNYLGPAFLVFGIGLGWAVAAGLEGLNRAGRLRVRVGVVVGVWLIFFNAAWAMAQADASRADAAERFGRAVLAQAPPNAIIVTREDRDSFVLWYWREAARERRDLVVVVELLLPFDWYREQLRWTYPQLAVPDIGGDSWVQSFANLNNRRVCRTVIDQVSVLDCS